MGSHIVREHLGDARCIVKHLKSRPHCSCLCSYAGSCLWYPGVRADDCEQTAPSVAWCIQTAAHLCEPLIKFPKLESSLSGSSLREIALLRLQLENPSTFTETNKSEREGTPCEISSVLLAPARNEGSGSARAFLMPLLTLASVSLSYRLYPTCPKKKEKKK